jgi:SPP1 gp7 family putative phage head morphogenesis protein
MLADVSRRDEKVWASLTGEMGYALREEIQGAPTGSMFRRLMEEQVHLITSLPLNAAERCHELVTGQLYGSARANAIAEHILQTGQVTESRAMLIARTEVGRAASALTQSRAQYVGSDGYIWRTAGDKDVRKLHRKLEGTFHKWDDPPVAGENGERAHAGAIYNCRCYPEPVLPMEFRRFQRH